MQIGSISGFQISRGASDLLKIVSAILVMFSHYFNLKAQVGFELNPFEWCVRSQGGNIGVGVFFFLSGYGLMMSEMKSHLPLKMFFRRRFCKIYLPVVLVTALWLPITYRITPPDTYWLIIRDLVIGFNDPVLWFIKSLILLYAVFWLSTVFIDKSNTIYFIVLCGGTVAVCFFSYYTNGNFGLNSISGLPLFSIGVVTALWSSKVFKGLHPAIIPLVLSFAAVSLVMSFYPRFVANLAHVIADYAVVATIIIVFSRWQPSIRIPAILSLITFDIYLIHFKVLVVMKEVTPTLPISLFIAVTVSFSIALYCLRTKLIKI